MIRHSKPSAARLKPAALFPSLDLKLNRLLISFGVIDQNLTMTSNFKLNHIPVFDDVFLSFGANEALFAGGGE